MRREPQTGGCLHRACSSMPSRRSRSPELLAYGRLLGQAPSPGISVQHGGAEFSGGLGVSSAGWVALRHGSGCGTAFGPEIGCFGRSAHAPVPLRTETEGIAQAPAVTTREPSERGPPGSLRQSGGCRRSERGLVARYGRRELRSTRRPGGSASTPSASSLAEGRVARATA